MMGAAKNANFPSPEAVQRRLGTASSSNTGNDGVDLHSTLGRVSDSDDFNYSGLLFVLRITQSGENKRR